MRVAVALLVLMLLPSACSRPARVVRVAFADAPGLREGLSVEYQGAQVGVVRALAFSDGRWVASLALDRPAIPIRTGDHIVLRPAGFFGSLVLCIEPGPASAPSADSTTILLGSVLRPSAADSAQAQAALMELRERSSSGSAPQAPRSASRP